MYNILTKNTFYLWRMRGSTHFLFLCLTLKGEEEDDLLLFLFMISLSFWKIFLFLLAIMLSVIWYTDSNYHFGIFKHFLQPSIDKSYRVSNVVYILTIWVYIFSDIAEGRRLTNDDLFPESIEKRNCEYIQFLFNTTSGKVDR